VRDADRGIGEDSRRLIEGLRPSERDLAGSSLVVLGRLLRAFPLGCAPAMLDLSRIMVTHHRLLGLVMIILRVDLMLTVRPRILPSWKFL